MAFPVLHAPLASNGNKYTMHHLTPFRIKLAGKGAPGCDLTVRVSYHSHVYSKTDSPAATELRFVDEGGKWREFCTVRYALCLGLPAQCHDLVMLNFPSWESEDNGGRNNMAVSEAQPASGTKYLIFYELFPSEAEGIDVEFVVKSAYEKPFDAARTGRRQKIHALLRTVLFTKTRMPK